MSNEIKEIDFISETERVKENVFIDTVLNPDMDVLFPPERYMEMQEDILWEV